MSILFNTMTQVWNFFKTSVLPKRQDWLNNSIWFYCSWRQKCSPDRVDDRVVAGVSLGEHTSPDGEQGADSQGLEDSGEVDDQVGRPRAEPQRDGHQGDLDSGHRDVYVNG